MKRLKSLFIISLVMIFLLSAATVSMAQFLGFPYDYGNLFGYNSLYSFSPFFTNPWMSTSFFDNSFDSLNYNNFSYFSYPANNSISHLFPTTSPISSLNYNQPFFSYNYGPSYGQFNGVGGLPGYTFPNFWNITQPYDFFGMNLFGGIYLPQNIQPPPTQQTFRLKTGAIDLSDAQTDNEFINKYSLGSLDIPLKVPPYGLPLQTNEIANFSDFSTKLPLSNDALKLLKNNGFVVISNSLNPQEEDITQPYKTLKDEEVPVFITTDSLLHLNHIQFDETLRQIEEREFYDKIWEISQELLNDSVNKYNNATGEIKEAAKRNVAYLAVGLSLLKPRADQLCDLGWQCDDPGIAGAYFEEQDLTKYGFTIPEFVRAEVEEELQIIQQHAGFAESPSFIYQEDYSQYVPRGHYTRSEKLKNYFKAFMWYGRISMLLKGTDTISPGETDNFNPYALISSSDAMIQTMQACLIASKFAESEDLKSKWDRIYSVTAFYVGLSDDLGPYEYMEAMNDILGGEFDFTTITEEDIEKIKIKLAEYRSPKIFGGTGNCGITPPFSLEQANECLEKTKGFRLMGQRFIPDSYMFSNLVGVYTDEYIGERNWSEVFTCVVSGAERLIRGFPRGLDVMALLGSKRAKEILDELDDDKYKNYQNQFKILEQKFPKR